MIHEKKSQNINIIIPLFLLFFSIFIYIGIKTNGFGYLEFVFERYLSKHINILENILILFIVFNSTYFFIKVTTKFIKNYLEDKGGKKDVKLFLNVYQYFIWILIIFVTFSLLFKQIGSLITSLGLIGFGVTFALQKPILNFVGWINIVFSRTYKIGDIISINNVNGKVYDIKVMFTNLAELSPDGDSTGKSVSIPNEFVLSSPVINFTKGTPFIWDNISIYLTYRGNWKKALKIVKKEIQNYYDKNIKPNIKKVFDDNYLGYEKIISRVNINEKGIHIKVIYLVDFNKSNDVKTELSQLLLNRLKSKDI